MKNAEDLRLLFYHTCPLITVLSLVLCAGEHCDVTEADMATLENTTTHRKSNHVCATLCK